MLTSGVRAIGAQLRAAHAARVPPSVTTSPDRPPRPLLWRWPFLAGGAAVFLLNVPIFVTTYGFGLPGVVAAFLLALPVAVCRYRPMAAWWLMLANLLADTPLTLLVYGERFVSYPWHGNMAAAQLPVMYVLALTLPRRVAIPTSAVTLVAGTAVVLVAPQPLADAVRGAIVWLLAMLVAIVLGHTRRARRASTLRVAEERQRVAEERGRRRLLEERARIARELHDMVAHHMSVIAVQSATAPYRVTDGVSEETAREFASINTAARESLREMRQLLGVLRAADDDAETAPQPRLVDLHRLAESARRAGTPVTLTITDLPVEPAAPVALSAYRMVQEGLSNVLRHALGAPTSVRVGTADTPDTLLVEVANEPGGASPAAPAPPRSGHGLAGMRERVAVLGGALTAGPSDDGGFVLRATLPLAPAADDDPAAAEPGAEHDHRDPEGALDDHRADRR